MPLLKTKRKLKGMDELYGRLKAAPICSRSSADDEGVEQRTGVVSLKNNNGRD